MKPLVTKTIFIAFGCMLCAFTVQAQKIKVTALKPAEFKSLIEKTMHPCIVDIRDAGDFEAGHIEGAINVDALSLSFIREMQNRCAVSDTILVYCKLGRTSKSVAELMVKRGFLHIYHLKGGLLAWNKQNP